MTTEKGYTQISNYLLSVLYGSRLNGSEAAVLAFIIRKTAGFHKSKDRLSYSQIAEATNLSEVTVIRAIKSLEKRGIIKVSRKGTKSNIITLASIKNDRSASIKSEKRLLSDLTDTKETQKETAAGFRLGDSTLAAKEIDITEEELGEEYE